MKSAAKHLHIYGYTQHLYAMLELYNYILPETLENMKDLSPAVCYPQGEKLKMNSGSLVGLNDRWAGDL